MSLERPGVTLSWLEAFRIVPELAETEVKRIIEELEQAKILNATLRTELFYARNRRINCGSFLRDAKRNLGIGNFLQAELDVEQAAKRLFPDVNPAE